MRARLSALVALLLVSLAAAGSAQLKVNPETGETQAEFAARTRWWRTAKFGMFIHWGEYAVPADSTQSAAEWYFYGHTTPDPVTGKPVHLQVREYEKFAAQFDPVRFSARQWVATAKRAGMKYIVITSKHHDGFCMFNSHLTNYTIVKATPFHRDPLKELAVECKRQGIRLGFYYSIMDWHHPDYLPRRQWDDRPITDADFNRYLQYMRGQLRELLTNYGDVAVIWFDGGWEHSADQLGALQTVRMMRELQPHLIVNDRINIPEDYSTPEQTIPANALAGGRLWETCMTLNNTWGYSRNDHDFKSSEDLVRKLCDIASKGGNFLLNVGPTELGEFTPETMDRLQHIGEWMDVNSASIYGTTQSPYRKTPFDGRCTVKGHDLYLQVFNWPADGLTVPGLMTHVLGATALMGNEPLTVTQGKDGIAVSRPARLDPYATVVRLRLAGAPVVVQPDTSVVVRPDSGGVLALRASDAAIHGEHAQLEHGPDNPNIGYWTDMSDTVSWTVDVPAAGTYTLGISYACEPDFAGSAYSVTCGAAKIASGSIESTGSWYDYVDRALGDVALPAGRSVITLTPTAMPHGGVMNLRRLTLTPTR